MQTLVSAFRSTPAARSDRSRALFLALAAAIGLAAVAPDAVADDDDDDGPRWQQERGGKPGYRGHDAGDRRDDGLAYARVIEVEPRVRQVRVEVPTRECWDETRWEEPRQRGVAGPMILGGVIGGALGNQIGRGDGRRAATVAGALVGTALGHDVGERNRDRHDDRARAYTVQRCDVRWETRYDERIEGYDVTYEYGGRIQKARLPFDPGPMLRVRVDVRPAERW